MKKEAKTTVIRVSKEARSRLKKESRKHGMLMTQYIEHLSKVTFPLTGFASMGR